jgi:hypothetical protein
MTTDEPTEAEVEAILDEDDAIFNSLMNWFEEHAVDPETALSVAAFYLGANSEFGEDALQADLKRAQEILETFARAGHGAKKPPED